MKNIEIINIPFEKAEYSVFDFETTGTSARFDKVIEIGAVKVKNGKIVDTYQSFINPGRTIPEFITNLTGITNNDVQNAPYFEDIIQDLINFFGDTILTAHNLQFDYSFLKNEFQSAGIELIDNPSICTLRLARKVYPNLKSKSLGSLTSHLKIMHKNVHRGLGDATVTSKLLLKMFKHLREEYNVETVSDLINFQSFPSSKKSFRIIKKKLASDFVSMPDKPGVYFFKDKNEQIIYIGKARNLTKRVKNYFSNTAPRKSKEIVRRAVRLGYYETKSEMTALLTEAELIKVHSPRFNSMLKKYSNHYFLKIGRKNKFAKVTVTSKFDFDGNDYFGPYNRRETAARLKEIIDRTFLLRECTEKDFKKKKKCYLADIERCLAPCVDNSAAKEYEDELNKAYEFLSGQNQSAVNRLLNKMKKFAERQKYESAAEIRDLVNLILDQLTKSSILAEPLNKANVLFEVLTGTKNDYILLIDGKIFIKDYILNENESFEQVLDDYYSGVIYKYKEFANKDLERLKIALSWLVKNRTNIRVHYLKNYSSLEELSTNIGMPKRKNIKT
jgi:DNA polymerase-3 subunit epsilon